MVASFVCSRFMKFQIFGVHESKNEHHWCKASSLNLNNVIYMYFEYSALVMGKTMVHSEYQYIRRENC